jgi:hypothetical protein
MTEILYYIPGQLGCLSVDDEYLDDSKSKSCKFSDCCFMHADSYLLRLGNLFPFSSQKSPSAQIRYDHVFDHRGPCECFLQRCMFCVRCVFYELRWLF